MDVHTSVSTHISHFSELVRYSRPMLTTAGVATLFIMVVGVVGNLLTVVALLRHSKLRTVAAAFIASLCVSDLLFCFLVLPFAASQFFHGTWKHGDFLCTLIPILRYGCVGVSLLSVAAISINRYILIAFPGLYQCIYTKFKVACYIAFIWLFSYGVQIPTMLGIYGKYGLDEKLGTCSIQEDENKHNPKTLLFVLGFALPCAVIVICYFNIYLVACRSNKTMMKHGARTRRSEMRITQMVIVIFVCFVVSYLPLTIVKVADPDVKHPPLLVMGYLLLYLACCINPVIYVTMNKQYREAYLDTLRCNIKLSLDSSGTPNIQNSKTHMSVSYLKNNISNNPKV